MKRRDFLTTTSGGVLLGLSGCLQQLQGRNRTETDDQQTADREGKDQDGPTDNPNSDDPEKNGGHEAEEEYTVADYERLDLLATPSLSKGDYSLYAYSTLTDEKLRASWMITSEQGGELVLDKVGANVDAFSEFIEETDFSESILLYANTYGAQTCTVIETTDVTMDGARAAVTVEYGTEPELGCGQAYTDIAELVRVTFDGPIPERSSITYGDDVAEATNVEDVEDWDTHPADFNEK